MALATYQGLSTEQRTFYVLTLIKRLLPYLPMFEDAQRMTVPEHSGGFGVDANGVGQIQFRKFNALAVPDAPQALAEGVAPNDQSLNVSTVTTYLRQYGGWIKVSDIAATASIDQVMTQAMEVLGENAGQIMHRLIVNELNSGAGTTVYAGGVSAASDLTSAHVLNSAQIKRAVRTLRAANVPTFSDGNYHAVIHPYQAYDLQADIQWRNVAEYVGGKATGNGPNVLTGEIGQLHGVRFRESTQMPTANDGAAGAATYAGFLYGPEAYGVFDFKSQALGNINAESNMGVSVHLEPVNKPTKDDPLGQFGFVSWKVSFASKVIDPQRVVRLLTGASS